MPRRRTLLDRMVQAVVGIFVVYISSSATEPVKTILLAVGIVITIHAMVSR